MQQNKSIKTRAIIRASLIILIFGIAVCSALIFYESYSIKSKFIQERQSVSETLAHSITRDAVMGNFYSVRNRLFEYSQQYNLDGLVLCTESGAIITTIESQYNLCSLNNDGKAFTRNSFRITYPIRSDQVTLGNVVISYKTAEVYNEIRRVIQATILAFLGILSAAIIIMYLVMNSILSPTSKYIKRLDSLSKVDNLYEIDIADSEFQSKEEELLNNAFITIVSKYRKLHFQLQEQAIDAAIGKTASQVSHDIRSPLSSMRAALMLLRDKLGNDKDAEDMLNLLQLSSNRLDNIANGLLAKYMGESSTEQLFSIHEVLDELVGELQASPLGQGTEFKKQYHTAALYVTGERTGMARALGNIIKNALEAMQQVTTDRPKQLIVATAFDGTQNLTIRIQDTGPGIPADKIPLILHGGYTDGKADGHGIGTKVVKEVVEAHKGILAIESRVGVGTTFIITLPATVQNDETIVTIPYVGSGVICVIDDEPSLREQWRLTLRGMGVTAKVFTCWEDFEKSDPSALPQDNKTATFIVDYHFDNSEVDGLEVISRLKARGFDKFILATAEYWKPAIQDAANKLNATLCPKPLPRVILSGSEGSYIEVSSALPQDDKSGTTVLLIDDDESIRKTWSVLQTTLGIETLHSFPNLESFIQAQIAPNQCDLCVIDKNIEGSEYDGARMLSYLKENGARKVFLATGEQDVDIRKDPAYVTLDGILTEKVPMSLEKYFN